MNSAEQEFDRSTELPMDLAQWCESTPVILDGKPFSFAKHEFLVKPYHDNHRFQVYEKACQMGLTTLGMLRALFGLRYKNWRGVMYLMPARGDAIDLSRSRIAPLIEQNPETIAPWIRDTDSAGLKQVWNGFLYIRGLLSRVGIKSVPSDMNIYDEISEAPPKSIDMAQERLSHSEDPHTLFLSNPTLPDYSISKLFDESDGHYWLLKCPKCGHFTCLETTFPQCLAEVGGRVIRACERCKGELNPAVGEWVPKRPSIVEKRGYHFSQLFSQFIDPKEILHQFRTTDNLQDFYNLKIGVPWIEAENRLSVQEVLALCGTDGIASEDRGPCSMGVDQGKDLHVVIGKRHPGKAGKIIHIGVYKDWSELDRLMKNFSVFRCVVDALPETRNARSFAERHKGRVFLNYYNIHQKGRYRWNEEDLTVQCNRTESLDSSHNEVMRGDLVLPKNCEIVREFAKHLHDVAKKLEEDPETGSKRYKYVKLGPDHFRHALNYEAMARQFGASGFFADAEV